MGEAVPIMGACPHIRGTVCPSRILLYDCVLMFTNMYIPADEEPKAFPAHQPVLDPPEVKEYYNSFMTSSKEAYTPPPKTTKTS